MNSDFLKSIKLVSDINPNELRKYDRMEVVLKFLGAKKEHPTFSKKELCASVGVSDSTLKRIMKDYDIPSFYRHEIPSNNKQKSSQSSQSSQSKSNSDSLKTVPTKGRRGRKTVKEEIVKAGASDYDDQFDNALNNLK